MTPPDRQAFDEVFANLRRVFSLRGSDAELAQIAGLYFATLTPYSLDAVTAGGEAWLRSGTRFPKPGDWIRSIPAGVRETVTVPRLDYDAALEWRRAERLHWEDGPCWCVLCRSAGVDHRFLRFVPEEDASGGDARVYLDGDRIVTRGHWAHGEELRAWYAARDHFWGVAHALGFSAAPGDLHPREVE